MRIKLILLPTVFALLSCGSGSESTVQTENNTADSLKNEVPVGETILPNENCFTLAESNYEVSDELGSIKSTANSGQQLSVVISTDGDIYLEISYDGGPVEESWKIEKQIDNPFSFSVKLEYTDANHDDISDELVIWWNQTDGNNGIQSGYEYSNSGIIIFDVMQRNVMLNLDYENHYASYSAAQNANTDAEDYHAKMAEDSDWEICSFYIATKLQNGELILEDLEQQIDGMGECVISVYEMGTYRYNNVEQEFQLVQE